jgi:hypothetical protein
MRRWSRRSHAQWIGQWTRESPGRGVKTSVYIVRQGLCAAGIGIRAEQHCKRSCIRVPPAHGAVQHFFIVKRHLRHPHRQLALGGDDRSAAQLQMFTCSRLLMIHTGSFCCHWDAAGGRSLLGRDQPSTCPSCWLLCRLLCSCTHQHLFLLCMLSSKHLQAEPTLSCGTHPLDGGEHVGALGVGLRGVAARGDGVGELGRAARHGACSIGNDMVSDSTIAGFRCWLRRPRKCPDCLALVWQHVCGPHVAGTMALGFDDRSTCPCGNMRACILQPCGRHPPLGAGPGAAAYRASLVAGPTMPSTCSIGHTCVMYMPRPAHRSGHVEPALRQCIPD